MTRIGDIGEKSAEKSGAGVRLHIGSGAQRLPGWLNVDIRPLPGVDVVADVTQGLDFRDIEAVYAEHFLEHLPPDAALDFLTEVHRVLAADGRLRLSTPNLDWVWRSHYRMDVTVERKRDMALMINRAFHGWEHKFLWNREILGQALLCSGFRDLVWHRYGESDSPLFRDVERHETYEDEEAYPHVIIAEGAKGTPDPEGLGALRQRFRDEFLDHVAAY
jgi:predicted SAM-dependent methyltransferase